MNTALNDVIKTAQLFSLPDVYLRLKALLDEPDYAMGEVAAVISHDPAMTLRLLRIVNSSLYGFNKQVDTVSRAIILLGSQQVHDIVLATSIAKAFKGISKDVMDVGKFWRRSVDCAVTCRHLAQHNGSCNKERLFVAGLLCDIGHLLIYQTLPNIYGKMVQESKHSEKTIVDMERELLGFDYAEVGAVLMEQWNLAESLKETTKLHTHPGKAEQYPLETALVHIGLLMTRASDGEGVFNEAGLTVDPLAWELTGLTPEACTELHEEIEKDVRVAMELIFM